MAFDPFAPIPPQGTTNPATPSIHPILPNDEDEDEVQFDLTGEAGNAAKEQEPDLGIHLEPIPTPAQKAPDFSAPWDMPKNEQTTKMEPTGNSTGASNPFTLDLGAPPAASAVQPSVNGLVALFERLKDMVDEEAKAYEASQRKHDANIANEQRLKEEETKAYQQRRSEVLQGLAELQKKLG